MKKKLRDIDWEAVIAIGFAIAVALFIAKTMCGCRMGQSIEHQTYPEYPETKPPPALIKDAI